jgi:hypothetical protein
LLGAASPAKSGYNFSYTPVAATPVTLYTILATPQSSFTGQRYFMTDQSGVIYQTSDCKVPSIGASDTTPIGQ